VLEPAHLLALGQRRVAGDLVGALIAQVQPHVDEAQPQAGDEDRRDRHQQHRVAGGAQARADQRALVAAEQALHARQRDRVHVPGVAAHVGDVLHRQVVRRMEAVVHRRRQPQRHVAGVAIRGRQRRVAAEQLGQGVRKALGLQHLAVAHATARPHDRVARACEHLGVGVERACPVDQRAGEAVVQAAETGVPRVAEVEVGEELPHRDRHVAHQRLLDAAEPAEEARRRDARDAIREQEVQVLVQRECAHHAPYGTGGRLGPEAHADAGTRSRSGTWSRTEAAAAGGVGVGVGGGVCVDMTMVIGHGHVNPLWRRSGGRHPLRCLR